jgi:malate synthase
MAYTPELSQKSSSMLRRIAWAVGKPMTITMEMIFEELPAFIKKQEICSKCRDKSLCSGCGFNTNHCRKGG